MRTKVFVSYSHADRQWLDRLTLHLAVLQRLGLVEVWSDTRIEVGAGWEQQIESALTEARVAVLMVTPAYLASEFVWEHEMPHIMRHHAAGMKVLPIITRPCAWRLTEELAALQARPMDERALSTGSEAQIDLDLAAFVYELAKLVRALPQGMATDEWDRIMDGMQGEGAKLPEVPARERTRPSSRASVATLAPVWRGRYDATGAEMTLRIERQNGRTFTGKIHYDRDDTVTDVSGEVIPEAAAIRDDPAWRSVGAPTGLAVTFAERSISRSGRRNIGLNGEYRAFIDGDRMSGGWFSENALKGRFSLTTVMSTA